MSFIVILHKTYFSSSRLRPAYFPTRNKEDVRAFSTEYNSYVTESINASYLVPQLKSTSVFKHKSCQEMFQMRRAC